MPTPNNNRKTKRTRTPRPRVSPAPIPQFNVPNSDAYSPSVWGANPGSMELGDVVVPSGQKALVRRPGMDGLIQAGVLMEMDSLTSLVDTKHVKRVKNGQGFTEEINAKTLMQDPAELEKVMRIVDRTMPYIVVRPEIRLHFRDDEESGEIVILSAEERQAARDAGFGGVFTDQIDLNDRMFLFGLGVGGSADLERFREQSDEMLDGVDDEQDVSDTSL